MKPPFSSFLRAAILVGVLAFLQCKDDVVDVQCPDAGILFSIQNTVSADVIQKIRYNSSKMNTPHLDGQPGTINPNYPNGKVVVIRVATANFPGYPDSSTDYWRNLFFNDDPTTFSVSNYFEFNSRGRFEVAEGGIPIWTQMTWWDNTTLFGVEGNSTRAKEILESTFFDWNTVDVNGDGVIASEEAQLVFLFPVWPDVGWASTRNVSLGPIDTPNGVFEFENRNVVYFSISKSGHWEEPVRGALAAYNHELGHAFFDFIDRYGNGGTIPNRVGNYDMMGSFDSNQWVHFNVYDKMKLDWLPIAPVFIDANIDKNVVLQPVEKGGGVIIVSPENTDREYWILCFMDRDADNFESQLPQDGGMAIFHVEKGAFFYGYDRVTLLNAAAVNGSDPAQIDYQKGVNNGALYDNGKSVELVDKNGDATGFKITDINVIMDSNGKKVLCFHI
ncbi:MAG: hypothetical protein H6563_06185 [Lewinellaceae bacterium]|nr:hypothetical protein [Lewinellaceae bacterium]